MHFSSEISRGNSEYRLHNPDVMGGTMGNAILEA